MIRQRKGDGRYRARRQVHALEAAQVFHPAIHTGHRITHIKLHNFIAGTGAGVLHVNLHGHGTAGCDAQVAVGEGGVAQAVPKREERREVVLVVVVVTATFARALIHIEALPPRWKLVRRIREADGEPAPRVIVAEEYIGQRVALFLAGI